MRTIDLIREANDMADENESNETVLSFLNQAIAKINTEMSCAFPYLVLASDNEPVISEKWQRSLLIPFAVGRIKQKDSSQFEYTDAYSEFLNNLDDFIYRYNVPEQYKCLEDGQNVTISDTLTTYTEVDDTLYSLALQYEVDWRDLISLNPRITFVEQSFTDNSMPSYNYLHSF